MFFYFLFDVFQLLVKFLVQITSFRFVASEIDLYLQ